MFTPILLVCCESLDGHRQVFLFTSGHHFTKGKWYHTPLQSTLLPVDKKYYFRISFFPHYFISLGPIKLCDLIRKLKASSIFVLCYFSSSLEPTSFNAK